MRLSDVKMPTDTHIVSDATFKQEVLDYPGVVIVYFWLPFCQPCADSNTTVSELSKEYRGRVKVCTMQARENPKTLEDFGIHNVPTLLFFVKGMPLVWWFVGSVSKERIQQRLDRLLMENKS